MSVYHDNGRHVEWVDSGEEYFYEPTEADAREAAEMFGELRDDGEVEEFEAWIDGLDSTRFFQVRSAIEVVRRALADYQADLDMTRLLKAIHAR